MIEFGTETVPDALEPFIRFQENLFLEKGEIILDPSLDCSFIILNFLHYIGTRPHNIDKIVDICIKMGPNMEFKKMLLKDGIPDGVSLIYRLFQRGFFLKSDIIIDFMNPKRDFVELYFRSSFDDDDLGKYGCNNVLELHQCFNFGFKLSSIGYSLKYDDSDLLAGFLNSPTFDLYSDLEWSDFEWSFKPLSCDLLSVCGHFGSIKSFKMLLIHGACVNIGAELNSKNKYLFMALILII